MKHHPAFAPPPSRLPSRLPLAGLLLATALGLAACGEKTEPAKPTPPRAAAPAPAAKPAPPPAASNDPARKVQVYIGCYNRLDRRAHSSIERYANWVKNMESGPTGKETVVYGLYSIDSKGVADCKRTMTEAAAQQPALDPLDPAAVAYANAIEAMDKVVSEAELYYSRQNYKDDQFAKGKALHAPLVAQFKAFRTASKSFNQALEVENDKLLAEQLAKVEKAEGRKLTYWRMSMMAQAKQLMKLLAEDEFPVDEANTRLAAYEKTTDEAMAYAAANKTGLPISWSSVERAAEDYRKAAKDRLRRIRDKVPYSTGDKMMLRAGSAEMVQGSQEQVGKAYNSLIEASNRLR